MADASSVDWWVWLLLVVAIALSVACLVFMVAIYKLVANKPVDESKVYLGSEDVDQAGGSLTPDKEDHPDRQQGAKSTITRSQISVSAETCGTDSFATVSIADEAGVRGDVMTPSVILQSPPQNTSYPEYSSTA